jgi:hypothetical protein
VAADRRKQWYREERMESEKWARREYQRQRREVLERELDDALRHDPELVVAPGVSLCSNGKGSGVAYQTLNHHLQKATAPAWGPRRV